MDERNDVRLVHRLDRHFDDVLVRLQHAVADCGGGLQGHFGVRQCSNDFSEIAPAANRLHRLIIGIVASLYGLIQCLRDGRAEII